LLYIATNSVNRSALPMRKSSLAQFGTC
jgi:hypothetical protein